MADFISSALGGASLFSNALGWFDNWLNKSPDWTAKGLDGSTVYTDSGLTKYFKDYDKAISDYFMNKEMDYNTMMSNTAYQRAVADMKAAGLNPAAMAGVQASAAAVPPLHSNNHTGAQSIVSHSNYGSDLSSMYNSAVNAMIAKDSNAAKLLASEIVDNAKHAHKMEELRESYELKGALQNNEHKFKNNYQSKQHKFESDFENNPKADYYDEKAREIRARRLKILDKY